MGPGVMKSDKTANCSIFGRELAFQWHGAVEKLIYVMRGDRAGQLVLSLISSTACVDSREEIQLKTLDGSAEKKNKKIPIPSRVFFYRT